MAADLAATPRSGFTVQCCGDAHLSNFGLYASPERRLVFDINDFDETLPGPWEWDVKRLAVSVLVAARHIGFSGKAAGAHRPRHGVGVSGTDGAVRGDAQLRTSGTRTSSSKSSSPAFASQVNAKMRRRLEKVVAKAVRRDSRHAFSKLSRGGRRRAAHRLPAATDRPTRRLRGGRGTRSGPRLTWGASLQSYRLTLQHDRRVLLDQFRLVDLARKVVGVGSVGTGAWIAMLLGRDGQDPLVLQIKEAQRSVLEEFAGTSEYRNSGERVVAGQRIMQASSDIFLGWLRVEQSVQGDSRDYYVRQLRDWKGSVVIENMNPRAMSVYGQLCAATLAHAHARSGDRVAIASYLGRGDVFDRAILAFAEAYAEQNDRDYEALLAAVATGRVKAVHGL